MKTYFRRRNPVWFILTFVMVITAACGGSEAEEPDEDLIDENAVLYRMYFDSVSEDEVQIRQFTGQLRMANIEEIFGDVDTWPIDENGNHVSGWREQDGLMWSAVVSASGTGLNLVSRNFDGLFSSAFDLNGDQIADIVDIRLEDGRRISFVTEGLGMEVFEGLLLGENPLCNNEMAQLPGLESFGCGSGENGSSGGGGSFNGNPSSGFEPYDPCADYQSGPGFSTHVKGHGYVFANRQSYFTNGGVVIVNQVTEVYTDYNYNHVYTTRTLIYHDLGGRIVQVTNERVEADGNGTRTIVTLNTDGTSTARTEEFEANLDEGGRYKSNRTHPPAEAPRVPDQDTLDEAAAAEEAAAAAEAADTSDASGDREGDPVAEGLEEYCERTSGDYNGTVEQVASTDPTAFEVGCDDLAGGSSEGGDCNIFSWARPEDFEDALHPSDDDRCGVGEEPDADGNCKGTSIQEMLRGLTARIASANLQGINICPPITCRGPGDLQENDAFESAEFAYGVADEDDFMTVTPTPTSQPSTANEDAPCYRGPGPQYELVSYLKQGVQIELLGTGFQPGWLVIDNPTFPGVSCWVEEDQVDLDPDLDLSTMTIFAVPILPTKTPKPIKVGPTPTPCVPDPNNPNKCP